MNFEKDLRNVLLVGFIPSFTTIFYHLHFRFYMQNHYKSWESSILWSNMRSSWRSYFLVMWIEEQPWYCHMTLTEWGLEGVCFRKEHEYGLVHGFKDFFVGPKKKLHAIYINNNFLVVKTFGLWLSLIHTAKGH